MCELPARVCSGSQDDRKTQPNKPHLECHPAPYLPGLAPVSQPQVSVYVICGQGRPYVIVQLQGSIVVRVNDVPPHFLDMSGDAGDDAGELSMLDLTANDSEDDDDDIADDIDESRRREGLGRLVRVDSFGRVPGIGAAPAATFADPNPFAVGGCASAPPNLHQEATAPAATLADPNPFADGESASASHNPFGYAQSGGADSRLFTLMPSEPSPFLKGARPSSTQQPSARSSASPHSAAPQPRHATQASQDLNRHVVPRGWTKGDVDYLPSDCGSVFNYTFVLAGTGAWGSAMCVTNRGYTTAEGFVYMAAEEGMICVAWTKIPDELDCAAGILLGLVSGGESLVSRLSHSAQRRTRTRRIWASCWPETRKPSRTRVHLWCWRTWRTRNASARSK